MLRKLNFFELKFLNSKYNLNLFKNKFSFSLTLKKFSTTPTTPVASGQGQVVTPPTKTKDQIKIETLMQQWPEYLRNPPKGYIDLEAAKELYEDIYKFHQGDKKYLTAYDLPIEYTRDMVSNVNNVMTTDAIADFFKNYEGFLPEHFIMQKFKFIAVQHGEKLPEFFADILPQVKKVILNADRHIARNLYMAVEAGTLMNLADTEFWDMIEFKLVNERLYRYLELKQAAYVAYYLAISGRGSKTLFNTLEIVFIKHRKAISLDKNIKSLVSGAYSIVGCSETLVAALDDPNIEVPSIDPKIPKMDRVPGGDSKRAPLLKQEGNGHKQISHHH